MPTDMSKYPADWNVTRAYVRGRSGARCECVGECGIHQPNPIPRRCCELDGTQARWFKGRVKLAAAHLCKCDPPCNKLEHIKDLCQRCHLRVDRFIHAHHRLQTQGHRDKTLE